MELSWFTGAERPHYVVACQLTEEQLDRAVQRDMNAPWMERNSARLYAYRIALREKQAISMEYRTFVMLGGTYKDGTK